jgi:hypothetical protein
MLVWTIINNQDKIMIIYNTKNTLIIYNQDVDYKYLDKKSEYLKQKRAKNKKGGKFLALFSFDYK